MAKTPSKKAPAKAVKKVPVDGGKKKRSKKRVESYSTYIFVWTLTEERKRERNWRAENI